MLLNFSQRSIKKSDLPFGGIKERSDTKTILRNVLERNIYYTTYTNTTAFEKNSHEIAAGEVVVTLIYGARYKTEQ